MVRRVFLMLVCGLLGAATCAAQKGGPNYSKDIAPLLNSSCVGCHRTGEIGPMPLTNYKEVRPFAKAIRDAVVERRMPPWHADPHVNRFANDRSLSEDSIKTIVRWVEAGAPEGNAKDLPPAPKFVAGWNIGKPDVVLTMPKPFEVPAEGEVDYQYMTVETGFTEDKWVQAAEVRPGNNEVVHHVITFILPPQGSAPPVGTPRNRFGKLCTEATPDQRLIQEFRDRIQRGRQPRQMGPLLVGWAPGLQPAEFAPGTAKLVPAGSRILFQLHYTPNGKATVDNETRIGLLFAKQPVTQEVHTVGISNMRITIPPNDPSYEAKSCYTLGSDVTLISMMPHMHYRGKDFKYEVAYPDGRTEALLSVPRYDFSWQLQYTMAETRKLPAGSRIDCTAHYDNTARNKYNPDPTKEVRWGDQTWEEMMIGWVTFSVDRNAEAKPAAAGGGTQ